MKSTSTAHHRGRQLVGGWQSFWFGEERAYTLGIVRIAFGLLMIGWTYLLASDLNVAFGTDGVVPNPPSRAFTWGIFHAYPGDSAVLIGWLVLMGASLALTFGWHSRIAAVLVFVLIVSFERRNPVIFNSGDTVIRITALYLALSPCGAAFSMDQRRRTGSFFSAREVRPWPLRLMQIQVTIIYLSTVVAKLAGDTWQNGTAVAYSLQQHDLLIVPAPSWLTSNLLVSNALTWGTLVIELAIGILVWNRAWRPWVLAAGVMLHLSISLFLEVGFFSLAMFVLYLAFVPTERAEALAQAVQKRLMKYKRRLLARFSEDDDEADRARAVATPDAAPRGSSGGRPHVRPPVQVQLPTGIFVGRDGDVARQRLEGGDRAAGKGLSEIGDPIRTGRSYSSGVSVPLDVIASDASEYEPTGRHARRPDNHRHNGELTSHTT